MSDPEETYIEAFASATEFDPDGYPTDMGVSKAKPKDGDRQKGETTEKTERGEKKKKDQTRKDDSQKKKATKKQQTVLADKTKLVMSRRKSKPKKRRNSEEGMAQASITSLLAKGKVSTAAASIERRHKKQRTVKKTTPRKGTK